MSCTLASIPITDFHIKRDARDIPSGDKPHRAFQVVLFDNENKKPAPFRLEYLEKLKNQDGRYSYHLPKQSGEFTIGQWQKYRYSVIEQSAMHQLVEVHYFDDDINGISRYRVEGTTVTPLYSRYFLPSHGISSLPYALVLAFIIYFTGRFLRKKFIQ